MDGGFIAIVMIFSPHLALACLVLVPIAVAARSRPLAIALVAVLALFLIRFGGEWWSPPATVVGDELRVATWNLEAYSRPAADAVAMLVAHPADVVALEELTPDVAAAIDADPVLTARYPFRALDPDDSVLGIGILSRYPVRDPVAARSPVRLEARLDLPDGELVILAAHPLPARIRTVGAIPVGFNPTRRNEDLELLRARVAQLDALGERVLFLGDFNTAPTEPAFGPLTGGLHDAHAAVGIGPGWTWRPRSLEFLGTGLLRIDLILSTAGLAPARTAIDCPAVGDHCLVQAGLHVGP